MKDQLFRITDFEEKAHYKMVSPIFGGISEGTYWFEFVEFVYPKKVTKKVYYYRSTDGEVQECWLCSLTKFVKI